MVAEKDEIEFIYYGNKQLLKHIYNCYYNRTEMVAEKLAYTIIQSDYF